MKQVLETNGMNIYANAALVNSMFDVLKNLSTWTRINLKGTIKSSL